MKRNSQRGAALLTAMIIVVLVATLATSMVWQQWRSIQVEEAERARTQSALILTGALDWARLILREDAKNRGPDDLSEPWAVPLAEARLSTFLAADRDNTDGGPEAFLSGSIVDAQSRYNLRNLTVPGDLKAERNSLTELFKQIGVSQDVALLLIDKLRSAAGSTAQESGGTSGTGGAGAQATAVANTTGPLMPETIQQLSWFGINAETLRRMEPYLVILPVNTTININTAPNVVIAAVLGGDLAAAEHIVQERQSRPFKTVDDLKKRLPAEAGTADTGRISTESRFFEVRGRLRLADRVLEERSLVERNGDFVVPRQRQRVSSLEDGVP